MLTVSDMRAAALAELRMHAQPNVRPTLTDPELSAILDSSIPPLVKRASFWVLSTFFDYDTVIAPTVRNGHWYRCINGGTSNATEPIWTRGRESTVYETNTLNADGSSLIWRECGPDDANFYDVRMAIYKAWILKAEKASANHSVQLGAHGFDRQQIYDHCVAKSVEWSPMVIY